MKIEKHKRYEKIFNESLFMCQHCGQIARAYWGEVPNGITKWWRKKRGKCISCGRRRDAV